MPEIDLTGVNELTYPQLTTWSWEVALYLFLGGLVAGLMVFNGLARLLKSKTFKRALVIADLAPLPLLALGMALLWLDLSVRWNFWRLFTTFQLSSPMSWGSWILVLASVVLVCRVLARVPNPAKAKKGGFFTKVWGLAAGIGRGVAKLDIIFSTLLLVLGLALGIYTGLLLSSMPARPLWNSALLAPLFLASGITSGSAFLCLFVPKEEQRKMIPYTLALCVVELALLGTILLTLLGGSDPYRRAGELLSGGNFGLWFWLGVVTLGLLVPATIEGLDYFRKHIPGLPDRFPAVLKLAGGIMLRSVVVFAGLQSFI